MTKACLYQVKTYVQQKPNTKNILHDGFSFLAAYFTIICVGNNIIKPTYHMWVYFQLLQKKHGNIHCRELLACCAILYNMWSSVWPHPLVHHWLDWRRREFLCVHIHHNIAHNNNNNHERLSLPLFSAKKG